MSIIKFTRDPDEIIIGNNDSLKQTAEREELSAGQSLLQDASEVGNAALGDYLQENETEEQANQEENSGGLWGWVKKKVSGVKNYFKERRKKKEAKKRLYDLSLNELSQENKYIPAAERANSKKDYLKLADMGISLRPDTETEGEAEAQSAAKREYNEKLRQAIKEKNVAELVGNEEVAAKVENNKMAKATAFFNVFKGQYQIGTVLGKALKKDLKKDKKAKLDLNDFYYLGFILVQNPQATIINEDNEKKTQLQSSQLAINNSTVEEKPFSEGSLTITYDAFTDASSGMLEKGAFDYTLGNIDLQADDLKLNPEKKRLEQDEFKVSGVSFKIYDKTIRIQKEGLGSSLLIDQENLFVGYANIALEPFNLGKIVDIKKADLAVSGMVADYFNKITVENFSFPWLEKLIDNSPDESGQSGETGETEANAQGDVKDIHALGNFVFIKQNDGNWAMNVSTSLRDIPLFGLQLNADLFSHYSEDLTIGASQATLSGELLDTEVNLNLEGFQAGRDGVKWARASVAGKEFKFFNVLTLENASLFFTKDTEAAPIRPGISAGGISIKVGDSLNFSGDGSITVQRTADGWQPNLDDCNIETSLWGTDVTIKGMNYDKELEAFSVTSASFSRDLFGHQFEGSVENLEISQVGINGKFQARLNEELQIFDFLTIANPLYIMEKDNDKYTQQIEVENYDISTANSLFSLETSGKLTLKGEGEEWNAFLAGGKIALTSPLLTGEATQLAVDTKAKELSVGRLVMNTSVFDLGLIATDLQVSRQGWDFSGLELAKENQEFSLFNDHLKITNPLLRLQKSQEDKMGKEIQLGGDVTLYTANKEIASVKSTDSGPGISFVLSSRGIEAGRLKELAIKLNWFDFTVKKGELAKEKVVFSEIDAEIKSSKAEDDGNADEVFSADNKGFFSFVGIDGAGITIKEALLEREKGLQITGIEPKGNITLDFWKLKGAMDLKEKSGSLKLEKISIPGDDKPFVDLSVPINFSVIGLGLGFKLGGGLSLEASMGISKNKPDSAEKQSTDGNTQDEPGQERAGENDNKKWYATGSIRPESSLFAEVYGRIEAGTDYAVSIGGQIYARSSLVAGGIFTAASAFSARNHKIKFHLQETYLDIAASMEAKLKIGASASIKAFKIYEKTLKDYTFKETSLGIMGIEGKISLDKPENPQMQQNLKTYIILPKGEESTGKEGKKLDVGEALNSIKDIKNMLFEIYESKKESEIREKMLTAEEIIFGSEKQGEGINVTRKDLTQEAIENRKELEKAYKDNTKLIAGNREKLQTKMHKDKPLILTRLEKHNLRSEVNDYLVLSELAGWGHKSDIQTISFAKLSDSGGRLAGENIVWDKVKLLKAIGFRESRYGKVKQQEGETLQEYIGRLMSLAESKAAELELKAQRRNKDKFTQEAESYRQDIERLNFFRDLDITNNKDTERLKSFTGFTDKALGTIYSGKSVSAGRNLMEKAKEEETEDADKDLHYFVRKHDTNRKEYYTKRLQEVEDTSERLRQKLERFADTQNRLEIYLTKLKEFAEDKDALVEGQKAELEIVKESLEYDNQQELADIEQVKTQSASEAELAEAVLEALAKESEGEFN